MPKKLLISLWDKVGVSFKTQDQKETTSLPMTQDALDHKLSVNQN